MQVGRRLLKLMEPVCKHCTDAECGQDVSCGGMRVLKGDAVMGACRAERSFPAAVTVRVLVHDIGIQHREWVGREDVMPGTFAGEDREVIAGVERQDGNAPPKVATQHFGYLVHYLRGRCSLFPCGAGGDPVDGCCLTGDVHAWIGKPLVVVQDFSLPVDEDDRGGDDARSERIAAGGFKVKSRPGMHVPAVHGPDGIRRV